VVFILALEAIGRAGRIRRHVYRGVAGEKVGYERRARRGGSVRDEASA